MSKAPRVFFILIGNVKEINGRFDCYTIGRGVSGDWLSLSKVLNGKATYVREMALRLEKAFLCASAAMRLG